MTATEKLLDEGVAIFLEAKEAIEGLREQVAGNTKAVATLAAVVSELVAWRAVDAEKLDKILEAATKEGSGELAEVLRHLEASAQRQEQALADLSARVIEALHPGGRAAEIVPAPAG